MSTELEIAFKDNWDGMKPLQPAAPNVEFVKGGLSNSFSGAAMNYDPSAVPQLDKVMNPAEPIVVTSMSGPDMNKPEFQPYQAEATGEFLRSGFESSKMGDVTYLSASVGSVAMELFKSVAPEPELEPEAFQPNAPAPQLAMNFAPKGPSVFGL